MPIENTGPGGVTSSYGSRTASQPTLINSTSPKDVYKEYVNDGEAIGGNLSNASVFLPPTDDYAGIMAAISAANGNGIVQLKPITYDIGGSTIPHTAGVLIRGAGWFTESTSDGTAKPGSLLPGGTPTGGTIIKGDGTAPLIAANYLDLGDIDNDGPYAANIVSRSIHGGGVADLALWGGTFGIKIGALNDAGPQHAYFGNLYVYKCTSGGIWLENLSMCNIERIYVSHCLVSSLTIASSGSSFNWGNSRIDHVFNNHAILEDSGQPAMVMGRHLWLLARAGGSLNDVRISAFTSTNTSNGGFPAFNAISAQATSGAGNVVDFAVPDLTKFPWGSTVVMSTAPAGFTVNRVYFVSQRSGTTGAGTIKLRHAMHDTAHITQAGLTAAACTFRALGFPHIEVSSQVGDEARPLLTHPAGAKSNTNYSIDSPTDVEQGGTVRIMLAKSRYAFVDIGGFSDTAAISTAIDLCCRDVLNSQINATAQIREDIDNASAGLTFNGSLPAINVQNVFGNGLRQRTNGSSQLFLRGNSNIPTLEASPTLGNAFLRGFPQLQSKWVAATEAVFFSGAPNIQIQENIAAGQTITLPGLAIGPNGDLDPRYAGVPMFISNPSANSVTIAGGADNNGGTAQIRGAGAAGTSFVLAANTNCILMASSYRSTGNAPTNLTYWARF